MKLNWKIALPSSIAVVASAVAIAVPLVIVKEARSLAQARLGNFVSLGGAAANFDTSKTLNVLALGDSDNAGYNGYMANALSGGDRTVMANTKGGGDYVSYSDFFAKSLKNHLGDDKVNYKNLAASGNLLSDISRQLVTPEVRNSIAEANIITLTIGANDLLRVFDVLGRNFWGFIEMIGELKDLNVNSSDAVRQAAYDKVLKHLFNGENDQATKDATFNKTVTATGTEDVLVAEFNEAYTKIANLLTGDVAPVLSIDDHYRETILGALRRGLAIIIRDLHSIAPQAQIVVLGHSFPFGQWPAAVIETPNAGMPLNPRTNELLSITTGFEELILAMKDGVKASADQANDFVDYFSMDELGQFHTYENSVFKEKNWRRVAANGALRDSTYVSANIVNNAMPNAVDIHPSTFGHDLVGDGLFRAFAPRLGITIDESKIQHSVSKLSLAKSATTPVTGLYAPNSPDPATRLNNEVKTALNNLLINQPNTGGIQLSELKTFQDQARAIKLDAANLWYRFDEDVELLQTVTTGVTGQILSQLDPKVGTINALKASQIAEPLRDYLLSTDAKQAATIGDGLVNAVFNSIELAAFLVKPKENTPELNSFKTSLTAAVSSVLLARESFKTAAANNQDFQATYPDSYAVYQTYKDFVDFNSDTLVAITTDDQVSKAYDLAVANAKANHQALLTDAIRKGFLGKFEALRTIRDNVLNNPLVTLEAKKRAYVDFFAQFADIVFNLSQAAKVVMANLATELGKAENKPQTTVVDYLVLNLFGNS